MLCFTYSVNPNMSLGSPVKHSPPNFERPFLLLFWDLHVKTVTCTIAFYIHLVMKSNDLFKMNTP